MPDDKLATQTGARLQPTCPRCGSRMILVGRLLDAMGNAVQFAVTEADGFSRPMGNIKSCYCNDCGEVTLTLE